MTETARDSRISRAERRRQTFVWGEARRESPAQGPNRGAIETSCRSRCCASSQVRHAAQVSEATHAALAEVPGISHPDSVPSLTRRFAAWLAARKGVRERLKRLEAESRQAASRE